MKWTLLSSNKLEILKTTFFFLIFLSLVLIFQTKPVYSAYIVSDSIPAGAISCSCEGTPPFPACANGQNSSTGVCNYPACEGGNSWYKYVVNATCYKFSVLGTCYYFYLPDVQMCSVGDKYNSSNPPVMNWGNCNCSAGGPYKTCCSGSTLVNATAVNIDPYDPPEAGCGSATVVYCGQAGQPACGQDACNTLAPPPQTSAIRGYKVLMPNNQNVSPAQGQTVWLDGGSAITNNPYGTGYGWGNVSAGSHTISVSFPNGYGVSYTSCENAIDCHDASDPHYTPSYPETNKASQTVNAPAGGSNDLWWHYYPPPTASIDIVGSNTRTVGETLTFNASASDANGNLQTGEIFWSPFNTEQWTSLGTSDISGSTASFSKTWNTTGVAPGTYVVVVNEYSKYNGRCTGNTFTMPAGWADCGSQGISTSDSDVEVVTLNPPPATLNVRLWKDDDGDGQKDSTEKWIQNTSNQCGSSYFTEPGAGIEITDWETGSTTTYYPNSCDPDPLFTITTLQLSPSQYHIVAKYLSGYEVTGGLQFGLPNWTYNSVPKEFLGSLESGKWKMFYFGLRQTSTPTLPPTPTLTPTPTSTLTPAPSTYTISGNVFNDTNRNGIQDSGETNYTGASLTLRTGSCTGTSVGTANSTSTSPGYSFSNLANNTTYYVVLTRPSGKDITTPNATLCSGSNYYVTRTIAGTNVTLHWGLANTPTSAPTPTSVPTATPIPASVWGKYFADDGPGACYRNHIQDCGEPPIVGSQVMVNDWSWIGITDSSGNYSISGPVSGQTYPYRADIPSEYSSLGYVRETICEPFTPGCSNPNVPAPPWWFYISPPVRIDILLEPPPHDITGNIFIDTNGNGIQDCSGSCNDGPGDEILYTTERIIELRTGSCTGTLVQDYNARGSYNFVNLTPGTYYIVFPRPSGYTITTPTSASVCSGSNYFVERVMPQFGGITQHWGIQPIPTNTPTPTPATYTLSGNVFVDNGAGGGIAGNGRKDGGEPNYTCATGTGCAGTINTGGSGTVSLNESTGTYTITNLASGSYAVSYTNLPAGYRITFPTSSYTATVGNPGCGALPATVPDGSSSFSCDATGNISNLNFGINNFYPWVQTKGGNIRQEMNSKLTENIPAPNSCPTTGSYASVPLSPGSPGIIFSGQNSPNLGLGSASIFDWQVGSSTFPELYIPPNPGELPTSYNSMIGKANQAGLTPTDLATVCTLSNCTLPANLSNGLYRANGDLTLNAYNFTGNRDYVILVNGNLNINGNIIVDNGSTATFIVKGTNAALPKKGIILGSGVTKIQGYFSTDQSFYTGGNNDCSIGADSPLEIQGTVVVNAVTSNGGSFELERDLCGGNVCPSVTVITRPDFILNAPVFLHRTRALKQEIAP